MYDVWSLMLVYSHVYPGVENPSSMFGGKLLLIKRGQCFFEFTSYLIEEKLYDFSAISVA